MVEWAQLIRAIRVEPDIDAPRLVAADWLLERGDPRGEMIVLECRLADLDLAVADRADLVKHHDLSSRRGDWEAPLRALGARSLRGSLRAPLEFRRGFIQAIMLVGREATNFGAACAREPIVELAVAGAGTRSCIALARTPELAQLRHLALGRGVRGFEPLLESPLLGAVRSLALPVPLTPQLARHLVRGSARPRFLYPWRWTQDSQNVATAVLLADGGVLDRLVELAPQDAGDALVEAFGRAPLAALRRVQFAGTPTVTARALAALGPRLDQLEELHLGTAWELEMLRVLVESVTSRNLTSLGVLAHDSVAALLESPVLASVHELDLSRGAFTPRLATALANTAYRMNLRRVLVGSRQRRDFRIDGVEVIEA